MRQILLTLVIVAGLAGSALAETITTNVNGMVCAFAQPASRRRFGSNLKWPP